jgi:hypothetical protein
MFVEIGSRWNFTSGISFEKKNTWVFFFIVKILEILDNFFLIENLK